MVAIEINFFFLQILHIYAHHNSTNSLTSNTLCMLLDILADASLLDIKWAWLPSRWTQIIPTLHSVEQPDNSVFVFTDKSLIQCSYLLFSS